MFWPWGMWDCSFPTRLQTHSPCIGRSSLNHWTLRIFKLCIFKPWDLLHPWWFLLFFFLTLAVLSTASNQGCAPQMATSAVSLLSVFNFCYGAENTQVWITCLWFLFRSMPVLCSTLFLSREENAFGLKKKNCIVASTCLLYRKGINRGYKAAQCGQLNSPPPIAQLLTETCLCFCLV